MRDITEAMFSRSGDLKRNNIKHVLHLVREALDERRYNPANQLTGYLIGNDPTYISSHNNAYTIIQSMERYGIIEELVRACLEENK